MLKKMLVGAAVAAAEMIHDPTACYEYGGPDNDCCAVKGTAHCEGLYAMEWKDVCYDDGMGFVAHTYQCYSLDQYFGFGSIMSCQNSDGSENWDCCAQLGQGACPEPEGIYYN